LSDDRGDAATPRNRLLQRLALAAILLGAALLRGPQLDRTGLIVPYYFAGVFSQLQSWHNLFFHAFDPAGFLSLDKPPLAFWLQTLSAKLLGFAAASVLLPQVLAGLASIFVLSVLVRRRFGAAAGLLAALFLAVTPVSVAVDHSNNTESWLVLVLLLAAGAIFTAIESGRTRWLLAAAALVGIGFNVKMAAALGVVPVFAVVYLVWASPTPLRRVAQLSTAAGVLAAVSLSWCLAYDLTPADSRPLVDSSPANSMLELAVGHNLHDRFAHSPLFSAPRQPVTPNSSGAARRGSDDLPAGPLRLIATALVIQIGWLYPLALIGGIAAWRLGRRHERAALAVWMGWTLVYGITFSLVGGLFVAYYVDALAAPLCALTGIGTARLWSLRARGSFATLALPAAMAVTALWQAYIVAFHMTSERVGRELWLLVALLTALLVAAGAAAAFRASSTKQRVCSAGGIALLLVMPGVLSLAISRGWIPPQFRTGVYAERFSDRPRSAADAAEDARMHRVFLGIDPKLLAFLEQNRAGETYLLATGTADQAAPIIIETGLPVLPLGFYTAGVPILPSSNLPRWSRPSR
jgi:4-amino-4-deoxy-L-arabinose transferase-like glycosyltransferase